jgi:hypothetical protein
VDVTIVLNLATVVIASLALLLALRQNRLSNGGNHLPVILEAFKSVHGPDSTYLEDEKYVLNDLAQHSVDCGVTELPDEARPHALNIGMFFDDLGKLVAHDIIDQELVVGSFGMGIVRMWDALAPYVYQQRRVHDNHFWIYFEDLAARTAATPNTLVYAALGLRSRPPQSR